MRDWDALKHVGGTSIVKVVQCHVAISLDVKDFHYGMTRSQKQLQNVDEAILHNLTVLSQASVRSFRWIIEAVSQKTVQRLC